MKVIAFDPYIKESPTSGVEMVEKDTLLTQSDFVSLHIPHTNETHYIIDKADFAKMKKGAILVNCARGGTVNEEALADALESGHLKAAGIDVFESEPVKELHRLAKLPNVSLTPHVGAQANEGQTRAGIELAEKFIEFFKNN